MEHRWVHEPDRARALDFALAARKGLLSDRRGLVKRINEFHVRWRRLTPVFGSEADRFFGSTTQALQGADLTGLCYMYTQQHQVVELTLNGDLSQVLLVGGSDHGEYSHVHVWVKPDLDDIGTFRIQSASLWEMRTDVHGDDRSGWDKYNFRHTQPRRVLKLHGTAFDIFIGCFSACPPSCIDHLETTYCEMWLRRAADVVGHSPTIQDWLGKFSPVHLEVRCVWTRFGELDRDGPTLFTDVDAALSSVPLDDSSAGSLTGFCVHARRKFTGRGWVPSLSPRPPASPPMVYFTQHVMEGDAELWGAFLQGSLKRVQASPEVFEAFEGFEQGAGAQASGRLWMFVQWQKGYGMDGESGALESTFTAALQRAEYLHMVPARNTIMCEFDDLEQFRAFGREVLESELDHVTVAPRNACEVHFVVNRPPCYRRGTQRRLQDARAAAVQSEQGVATTMRTSTETSTEHSAIVDAEQADAGTPAVAPSPLPEPSDSSNADATTQDVVHDEPAAQIDPREAAETAHEQWAGLTELVAKSALSAEMEFGSDWLDVSSVGSTSVPGDSQQQPQPQPQQRELDFGETVFLVHMRRVVPEYQEVLKTGADFDPVRIALEEHECNECKWYIDPPGAFIFTYPEQYREVRPRLKQINLQPHHVVISQAFMPLLEDALAKLPSKMHVKVRYVDDLALIPEEGVPGAVVVKKTFIHHDVSTEERSVTHSAPARLVGTRSPQVQPK